MRAVLSAVLLLLLSATPGIFVTDRLLPTRGLLERRVLGVITGFGMLVVVAYLTTLLHAPMATLPILGVGAIVLGWCFVRGAAPAVPGRPVNPMVAIALGAVLASTFAWFAVPVWMRALPQGWDPAFHVSAIELIRTEGRIPETWAPFEPGEPFNYPAALHSTMAIYGRLSGLPSDRVFTVTMLALAALTILAVYLLGSRLGGDACAGALAVLLYGFTEGWGTLASHASWGGLANMASLVLMWGLVVASLAPGRGAFILTTVLAVAMAVLHHLSFAIVAFTVFFAAGLEWLSERRLSGPVRRSVGATSIAMGTAGVLVLLRPTGRFSIAEAFHFDRESIITLPRVVEVVGWPVLGLGCVGLALVLMKELDEPLRVLAVWTVGLLAFWVTWDIVYRIGAWAITHQNFTAFTPSRGLTDAAVLLSVLGGIALWRIVEPWPHRAFWMAAAFLFAIAYDWPAESGRVAAARDSVARADNAIEFCREVREHTPDDAVVMAKEFGDVDVWLPYLCNRELNYFPDPGYATSRYRDAKMRANNPVAFARLVRHDGPRPAYYATRRAFNGGRLVFTLGEWRLYELPG